MLKNLNLILDRLNLWRLEKRKNNEEFFLIKGKIILAYQLKMISHSSFSRIWKLIEKVEKRQKIYIK